MILRSGYGIARARAMKICWLQCRLGKFKCWTSEAFILSFLERYARARNVKRLTARIGRAFRFARVGRFLLLEDRTLSRPNSGG